MSVEVPVEIRFEAARRVPRKFITCPQRSDFVCLPLFGRWLTVVLFAALLIGCRTVAPVGDADPPARLIHVTSNGWHTAIIVPVPLLAATGAIPEAQDFPRCGISRVRLG